MWLLNDGDGVSDGDVGSVIVMSDGDVVSDGDVGSVMVMRGQ